MSNKYNLSTQYDLVNDREFFNNRISSREKLKKRSDILSFFIDREDKIKVYNYLYTILALKNNLNYSRFAVSIKKNKANAVKRNKSKRIVREIYRCEKHNIPLGFDYFIIVNRYNSRSFEDSKKELLKLFQRIVC